MCAHASPSHPPCAFSAGLLPGPRSSASWPSLSAVSEGRRDQCEAPSDPKFPDCSGKVEVRLGAEGWGWGDQEKPLRRGCGPD